MLLWKYHGLMLALRIERYVGNKDDPFPGVSFTVAEALMIGLSL